ncbi:hypothetical protein XMD579_000931 [Marinobacterium sp. xm-d-579]|uniref:DUF3301 domain-containing protein n=1 Tax=Marinobacterium sp. xm-d-579 TaxID=2497734 RepID=UPI00156A1EBE|nr:hypothetical protein [Marinobacterium sp. xm-d-579]
MFIELTDLFLLTLVAGVIYVWYKGLAVRERALNAVESYCNKLDLQLLDQNVSLRALWLKRDDRGRLTPWRRYQFEFTTTGDQRYRGQVVLLGNRLESITSEAHKFED